MLYRVTQEALTNVGRNSKASQVEVSIRSVEEMIRMEIKDNGQGFEVDAANSAKKSNRRGLLGMRAEIPIKNGGRRKTIAVAI